MQIIRHSVSWREKSLAMKMLAVLLLASWIGALISGLIVGGIQVAALGQPNIPTPLYKHAHEIKGVVRYFTDTQERLYSIAFPTLMVNFSLGVLLTFAYEGRRRADHNRRKKAFFDQIEP
jgi:hypothetical protein